MPKQCKYAKLFSTEMSFCINIFQFFIIVSSQILLKATGKWYKTTCFNLLLEIIYYLVIFKVRIE